MSSDCVLEFKNVSKVYSPYDGLNRVKDFINRLKNFQFTTKLVERSEFYALNNVSFKVSRGERVGLIGRNGAGKSTTLKLINNVSRPTHGELIVRGKVGGVLELGSGFHPDLSARENVTLQGAIYGYSKAEMEEMFPKIIAMAELEDFSDVAVKKFSVAISTTPDIVLLDEVLAVGDASFKKKSLQIMEQFIANRTLFFVSHSLNTVKSVCERVIVLDGGEMVFDGPADEGVDFYNKEVAMKRGQSKTSLLNRGVTRGVAAQPKVSVSRITKESTGRDRIQKFDIGINAESDTGESELYIAVKRSSVNNILSTIYEHRMPLYNVDEKPEDTIAVEMDFDRLMAGEYTIECFAREVNESGKVARIVERLSFVLESQYEGEEASLVDLKLKSPMTERQSAVVKGEMNQHGQ